MCEKCQYFSWIDHTELPEGLATSENSILRICNCKKIANKYKQNNSFF